MGHLQQEAIDVEQANFAPMATPTFDIGKESLDVRRITKQAGLRETTLVASVTHVVFDHLVPRRFGGRRLPLWNGLSGGGYCPRICAQRTTQSLA
jgi:hypothetical protein